MSPLTLPHLRLIDTLAEAIAADYLRAEAARQQESAGVCSNPVPLPVTDQAA
ncbi:hypothetical protein [Xanthomonas sp. XNM01]|uniref:hypothetical protein n=1 Tax=Xanthomonas sp. XNM01 TaxID=2769289 RepID=UPI0017809333|nr:hypothetical protein [Xanthomonas sp. XNM01]MBD9368814.1 hypothetical protein [Xanthomonas sp. XNM01]